MLDETRYLIVISMYARTGYVETGQFIVGNDKSDAMELFHALKGNHILAEKTLLRLDLVARGDGGLDTILDTLVCTLCEMSENIKIIMRETFKMLNFV